MTTIPIYGGGVYLGSMEPLETVDLDTLATLVQWRNAHRECFLFTGEVTADSTRQWLNQLIPDPMKMLYGIYTSDDLWIGTYGFTEVDRKTCELGNLLRGRPGGHKDLIRYAEIALLKFLFQHYQVVIGEVFSHNTKVLRLHQSTGFRTVGSVELCKQGDLFTPDPGNPNPAAWLTLIRNTRATFEEAIRYEHCG